MERRNYKVLLSVNFNKEINLVDELDRIMEEAYECTRKNDFKSINLCSIEKDKMEILTSISSKKRSSNFMLSSISAFLRRVCKIYNLEYDTQKGYFTIEEFSTVPQDEYWNLFRNGALNIEEILKKNLKNKQMKNSESSDNELEESNNKTLENTYNSDFDTEKFKKPKRIFKEILTGKNRQGSGFRMEDIEFKTLEDTIKQLDSLVGMEDTKEKIKEITSFIMRNNQRCVDLNIDNPGLYYNVAITGNRGAGKNTIAKILYHIYYHLGVIGKGEFIYIDSKDVYPGSSLDRYIGSARSGVIFIDNAQFISITNRTAPKDNYTTLDEWLSVYKNNFVFILAGETEGTNEVIKNEKVKKHMNFILNIKDFNEAETVELVKNSASKEKYNIDNNSEETILKYISYLKDKKIFENAYTAKRIVEKAIINNGIINNSNCLVNEDFLFDDIKSSERENADNTEVDPLEELIGLNEVKEKIKEISAYTSMQLKRKELGLKTEPICLHMNYVGNPGTGKTTVARLMGKIFKKIGILNTGKFVEASREDLVGKYVGHTAIKTAEKIKEAEGGILFIDEAYSLVSDSSKDYGYEAVNTIVKKMEDLRDNMVIIFAGYPKEMLEFVNMNPGLKDRIQFKLEFVDYKPEELLEIWIKFFEDSQYEIEENALDEMTRIVDKIYKNRDNNFSNARIMRKCFERIKMGQAVRIMKNNLTESDDIIKINIEDVKKLYDEKDISELQEVVLKRCIGFIR
ncbi:AAA family ATPase [Clostridium beijerinckii]|uniref:Stage V sporulation protein K n=1 Tax=Clostridium beijerinckii TaxID=1520 RepID=A0A1S8S0P5_CLOBE|nr:AAA family ATPase [Clostridium beijerinckii]NRY64159.1 adenylate kinase family enzyme [Clostridium beijerinckii]OOM59020.1 stage V sporulation protein K [Clostridium beijerinckii]